MLSYHTYLPSSPAPVQPIPVRGPIRQKGNPAYATAADALITCQRIHIQTVLFPPRPVVRSACPRPLLTRFPSAIHSIR